MKNIYIGLKLLTPETGEDVFYYNGRSRLLEQWHLQTGETFHPNLLAHHCTLIFKPTDAEVCMARILDAEVKSLERTQLRSKTFEPAAYRMTVNGYAADRYCQAFAVDLSPYGIAGFPKKICTNAIPHITVATYGGKPPVYSNELLAREMTPIKPFAVYGTLFVKTDGDES